MIKRIKLFAANPLIAGSTIVVAGSFISNILNYLFNLFMGRVLKVEEYGLLTALVSVWILFAVMQASISGILAKFTAKYSARDDAASLTFLINFSLRTVFIFGLFVALLLILGIRPFSYILRVDDLRITFLLILMIFVSLIQSVPLGILQGKLRFSIISVLSFSNPLMKIILSFIAIYLGFGVFGVIFAIFLSTLLPLVFVLWYVYKNFRAEHKRKINLKPLYKEVKEYSSRFFLATLGVTILSHGDIILVRSFLNETVSGQYAALSLMGKAIFYLTGPISFVLYPLIAQKKEKKESVYDTMLLAGLIVVVSSTVLSFIYFMFPHIILSIFFPGPDYQVLSKYLGPYSLFVILFSIVNLMNNYFFSAGKTGVYKINIFAGILFLALFMLFHDSLYQVIGVLFTSTLIMLMMYLYFYRFNGKN